MRSLVVVSLAALAIVTAAVVGTTPATAGPGPTATTTSNVAASGTARCTMTQGAMTIAPGLRFGGTAPSVTFLLTAMITCASGTSGVKGGSITAQGTSTNNDCGILAGTGLPAMTGTVAWKGLVAPSSITFSNGNFAITSTGISLELPSTGPSPPGGAVAVTGSFAAEPVSLVLVADQSVSTFAAGCYNATTGLGGFTFTGVNGASTLTVGQVAVTPPTTPTPPGPATVAVDASHAGIAIDQGLVGFNHPVAGSEPALASVGTTWARTDVSFEVNQGTPQAAYNCTTGGWDPKYLDGNIAIDRAARAQPQLIVDYFPSCVDFQLAGLSSQTVSADKSRWAALVYQMALHAIGVDHVTTFEVWNEPNFYMTLHNSGTVPGYLTLYRLTAKALEKAATALDTPIQVGGPGVDELGQIDNTWVTALAKMVTNYHLPLDFVSWHQYPNDPNEGPQSFVPNGICETGLPLDGQPCWNSPAFDVSLYARGAASVRAALAAYPSLHPRLWVDEWAPDSGNDVRESGPFGAAFVAAALDGAQAAGIDRMTYYDVADPPAPSAYNNFGILDGTLAPKPVYDAFAMWHQLAGASLPVNISPTQTPGPGIPQIGAMASVDPSGTVRVLVYNFDPYDPTGAYGATDPTVFDDQVTVDLSGLPVPSYAVARTLVDGSHAGGLVDTGSVAGATASIRVNLAGEAVSLLTLTPPASS
jgi:hypothetical protein